MITKSAADLAILGGRIRTLDAARPLATAVALKDGIIIGVGSDAEVRALCGSATELIDGRGLALVPGLIDSHQHALSAATIAPGKDVCSVKSLEELRRILAAERARREDEEWIHAWGLDYNVFGNELFSNEAIEDVVAGSPALIRTMDGHTGIASRRALELAGVTGPIRFSDGAQIVCQDGAPTGILCEPAAIRLVAAAAPQPTSAERKSRALEVLDACIALGITQIHQMDSDEATFDLVRELEESGQLKLRVVMPVWHKPGTSADQLDAEVAMGSRRGKLWRGRVAKFFADGVIDNGTAWLVEPDTRGGSCEPSWPDPAEYEAAVAAFSGAGFQCVTHATGDQAVPAALDAYRKAGAPPGVHHRIEHIETLQDSDVPRFSAEGVIASMQPLHMQWRKDDGTDWWTRMLGPERAARGFRCHDLLAAGATLALGSDWPIAHYDPRLGMAWARLRRRPQTSRSAFEPDQRLTAMQALEGYTTMAALAAGDQDIGGRIKEGYRADLTGFADDPVDCPADDLVDLPVRLTVVDGRLVFRSR